MDDDLITVRQAAKLMRCSRALVEKRITKGRLEIAERVVQIGQRRPIRLVRRSDVERLVAASGE